MNAMDDPNLTIEPKELHLDMPTKSMLVVSEVSIKEVPDERMVDVYVEQVKAAGNPAAFNVLKEKRKGFELTRLGITTKGFADIRFMTPAKGGSFYQFDYIFPEDVFKEKEEGFNSSNLTIMKK